MTLKGSHRSEEEKRKISEAVKKAFAKADYHKRPPSSFAEWWTDERKKEGAERTKKYWREWRILHPSQPKVKGPGHHRTSTTFVKGQKAWNKGVTGYHFPGRFNGTIQDKRDRIEWHNDLVLQRMDILMQQGAKIVSVDLPGETKSDILYILNNQLVGEDIKTSGRMLESIQEERRERLTGE